MTSQCPSCGCSQPFGLLCSEDTATLQTMSAAVPELLQQLDVAVSKQARIGGAGKAGKGTAREQSPVNWGVAAVRDALLVEMSWIEGWSIDDLRRHVQIAEIMRDFGKAVANAYRAIDRMADRQYLGQCLTTEDQAVCHAEIWVRPGAHQITCTQCDTTHNVGERRASLLEQAADMLVTVREASQVIGSYGEMRVTESTIRSYVSKGLVGYHGKVSGSSVIRLGDLMEVVARSSSATRWQRLRSVS